MNPYTTPFAIAGLLAAMGLACGSDPPKSYRSVRLTAPKDHRQGGALALKVSAGVLPPSAKLVVRSDQGKILGTFVPFGTPPGKKAGVYKLRLNANALQDGAIVLRIELVEPGAKPRPPTDAEWESAELVTVPSKTE